MFKKLLIGGVVAGAVAAWIMKKRSSGYDEDEIDSADYGDFGSRGATAPEQTWAPATTPPISSFLNTVALPAPPPRRNRGAARLGYADDTRAGAVPDKTNDRGTLRPLGRVGQALHGTWPRARRLSNANQGPASMSVAALHRFRFSESPDSITIARTAGRLSSPSSSSSGEFSPGQTIVCGRCVRFP